MDTEKNKKVLKRELTFETDLKIKERELTITLLEQREVVRKI